MWRRISLPFRSSSYLKYFLRHKSRVQAPAPLLPDNNVSDVAKFDVGALVHGFLVQEKRTIPEFKVTAVVLQHEKTKAEYLHLFRNDNNNAFSINFRTTPLDSTGSPHILEHMVLCGSKLYPVRDPFFQMSNRSLATFMNAFTAPDFTMYPFSTQNCTDFRNLQQIYLDAVFRPLLSESDFRQEGWRLENLIPTDIKSELVFKGVVYNEMKGAFSENGRIFVEKFKNLILPDHTYGVISGGDPLKIPTLTYEDLKAFHRNHYHPSNSRFYSYGNFSLSETLKYINDKYLRHYEFKDSKHTVVPKQKRWTEPKTEQIYGRYEKMREPFEKQNVLAVSLLMCDITESYETFVLRFVSDLLLNGPNAPFYKSMIEPNFSGGYIPSCGYAPETRDTVFTFGLQGLSERQFEKVTRLFDQTVDEVIQVGFEKKHVNSLLHQNELVLKHEKSSFGLDLLYGIISVWNHNGNILENLQGVKQLDRLKNDLKGEKFSQSVVEKYFKNNKHRLTLIMSPDKDYEKKLEAAEKQLLQEKTINLTDADRSYIYSKGLQLIREQSQAQDTNVLPTLLMDDIPNKIERFPKENVRFKAVEVQVNKVNCNGVYFGGIFNTSDFSPEQQMLLPLFCYVITNLGTEKMSYKEFDNLIHSKTGGLSLSVNIAESLYHLHNYEPSIAISSHCLEENAESMWDLWNQVFAINELKDSARFETLVKLYISNLTHGITEAGHIFAIKAAAGLVSGTAYQIELLSGLQHISYMKRLVHISNYKAMLDEMLNIANMLFDKKRLRCSLNVSNDTSPAILKTFKDFVLHIPTNPQNILNESSYVTGKVWTPRDAVHCQHHVLNIPVHYCSKAILTSPYTQPDHAKLNVLARLLSAKYLHQELREKHGAYGGGADMTPDGVFTFYSYRDPRNLETLDIFDDAYSWLNDGLVRLKEQDMVEAKLGVFRSIDAPIPPSDKGSDEFLRRLTPDIIERHRASVMTVSLDDLRSMADKYFKNINSPLSSKVILGPKSEKLKTGGRPNELWTVVDNE